MNWSNILSLAFNLTIIISAILFGSFVVWLSAGFAGIKKASYARSIILFLIIALAHTIVIGVFRTPWLQIIGMLLTIALSLFLIAKIFESTAGRALAAWIILLILGAIVFFAIHFILNLTGNAKPLKIPFFSLAKATNPPAVNITPANQTTLKPFWSNRAVYRKNTSTGKITAEVAKAMLEENGFKNVFIRTEIADNTAYVAVYAGRYANREDALKNIAKIKNLHSNFKDTVPIELKR